MAQSDQGQVRIQYLLDTVLSYRYLIQILDTDTTDTDTTDTTDTRYRF